MSNAGKISFSKATVGGDNKLESINVSNMGTLNLTNTEINGGDSLKAVNVLTAGKLSLKDSSLHGDSFNLTVQDSGTVELDNSTLSINNAAPRPKAMIIRGLQLFLTTVT